MRLGKKKNFFEYKNVNLSFALPQYCKKNKTKTKERLNIKLKSKQQWNAPPSIFQEINKPRLDTFKLKRETHASLWSVFSFWFPFLCFFLPFLQNTACASACVYVWGGGMRVDGGGKVR